jgi:hypothetical protein
VGRAGESLGVHNYHDYAYAGFLETLNIRDVYLSTKRGAHGSGMGSTKAGCLIPYERAW